MKVKKNKKILVKKWFFAVFGGMPAAIGFVSTPWFPALGVRLSFPRLTFRRGSANLAPP
jgi:hypothetical protein